MEFIGQNEQEVTVSLFEATGKILFLENARDSSVLLELRMNFVSV